MMILVKEVIMIKMAGAKESTVKRIKIRSAVTVSVGFWPWGIDTLMFGIPIDDPAAMAKGEKKNRAKIRKPFIPGFLFLTAV